MALGTIACFSQFPYVMAAEPSKIGGAVPKITKETAKAQNMREVLTQDPKLREDPPSMAIVSCIVNVRLDEIFQNGKNVLTGPEYNIRHKAVVDGTPEIALKTLECAMKTYGGFKPIEIDDLRADFLALRGQKVAVMAEGIYLMNSFLIRKTSSDISPIPIDITKISREQRLGVIQSCNTLTGCMVRVSGIVGKVNNLDGIIADFVSGQ